MEHPYYSILNRKRPVYDSYFLKKHPPMENHAKLFMPFAALDGFEDTLQLKDITYCPRELLSEEEQADLNSRIGLLADLTSNGKAARRNRTVVTVEYFSPCTDIYSDAFGSGGTYKTITDVVWMVDLTMQILLVGETAIDFDLIKRLDGKVFDRLLPEDIAC
jgi:hypothetical protein